MKMLAHIISSYWVIGRKTIRKLPRSLKMFLLGSYCWQSSSMEMEKSSRTWAKMFMGSARKVVSTMEKSSRRMALKDRKLVQVKEEMEKKQ